MNKDKRMSKHFTKFVINDEKFDFDDFKTREEFTNYQEELKKFNENPEKFLNENTFKMELHIELIPEKAWGVNLRTKLKKSDWDKIRKAVYAKEQMKCHICYDECKSLDAHEVWEFDEENHIQKLVDIIGVCKACHNTIHYGRACKFGTHKEAMEHYLKVNQCDRIDWIIETQEAQKTAIRRRSIPSWKLDISLIEDQGYKRIDG